MDILAITETWLTTDVGDSEVCIDGYSAYRKDREGSCKEDGGGIIIYIRNGINCSLRPDLKADDSENIGLKLTD